jgi:hypothetical protein
MPLVLEHVMKILWGIPQKFLNMKGVRDQIKLENAIRYEIGWRIDNPTSEDIVIKKLIWTVCYSKMDVIL